MKRGLVHPERTEDEEALYLKVRLGGHPILPFKKSRWGFSGKWTPFYKKGAEKNEQ